MFVRYYSQESNQIAYEEAKKRMEIGEFLEAFKGFLTIAQRGHSPSMSMLGALLTQHGIELKEYGGYEEGISWYRKAATCGYDSAISALSSLNEKPVVVFKSVMRVVVPNVLIVPLCIPLVLLLASTGIHMLHAFILAISIMCYLSQLLQQYYLFEACRIKSPYRRYEVEKEYVYSSLTAFVIFIAGMILFVVGLGLAAKEAYMGESGLFIAALIQIIMSAWIIYIDTVIVIKIKRRSFSDSQYKALMALTAKLGNKWETFLVPLLFLSNSLLLAMCLYRVITIQ